VAAKRGEPNATCELTSFQKRSGQKGPKGKEKYPRSTPREVDLGGKRPAKRSLSSTKTTSKKKRTRGGKQRPLDISVPGKVVFQRAEREPGKTRIIGNWKLEKKAYFPR